MASGDYVVDVCKQADPTKLAELVGASKTYWTGPSKGYRLLSDEQGGDFLRAFESKIENGMYITGDHKFASSGEVVLIYEKVFDSGS